MKMRQIGLGMLSNLKKCLQKFLVVIHGGSVNEFILEGLRVSLAEACPVTIATKADKHNQTAEVKELINVEAE